MAAARALTRTCWGVAATARPTAASDADAAAAIRYRTGRTGSSPTISAPCRGRKPTASRISLSAACGIEHDESIDGDYAVSLDDQRIDFGLGDVAGQGQSGERRYCARQRFGVAPRQVAITADRRKAPHLFDHFRRLFFADRRHAQRVVAVELGQHAAHPE